MLETIIAVVVVVLALAGVGVGLYRAASGKGGCASCRTCDEPTCATEDSDDDPDQPSS
jgi:hypothetical protein